MEYEKTKSFHWSGIMTNVIHFYSILQLLKLDPTCMNVVLEMYNDGRHLSGDETTLRGEGLYRKHTVFYCYVLFLLQH